MLGFEKVERGFPFLEPPPPYYSLPPPLTARQQQRPPPPYQEQQQQQQRLQQWQPRPHQPQQQQQQRLHQTPTMPAAAAAADEEDEEEEAAAAKRTPLSTCCSFVFTLLIFVSFGFLGYVVTRMFANGRLCEKKSPPAGQAGQSSTEDSFTRNLRKATSRLNLSGERRGEASSSSALTPKIYPTPPSDTAVTEKIFDTIVTDNHPSLKDLTNEKTINYVKQLNKVTRTFVDASPQRTAIEQRFQQAWEREQLGSYSRHGSSYYYEYSTKREMEMSYLKQSSTGRATPFDRMQTDDIKKIMLKKWDNDGSILAYIVEMKNPQGVRNVRFIYNSGVRLTDEIVGVQRSSLAWLQSKGVFYTKYRRVVTERADHAYQTLYFHTLEREQRFDVMVADIREHPKQIVRATVSLDGSYLIVNVYMLDKSRVYFYDLRRIHHIIIDPLQLTPLFTTYSEYDFVDNFGSKAFFRVCRDAPMCKLISVQLDGSWDVPKNWEVVVEENPREKLHSAAIVTRNLAVLTYVVDVKHEFYVQDLRDKQRRYQLKLPEADAFCQLIESSVNREASEIFLIIQTHTVERIVYRGNFHAVGNNARVKLEEMRRTRASNALDPSLFKVEQFFHPTADGTERIPMYVISRKDMQLNGSNPTILTGDGGFGVSLMPEYSTFALFLVRLGFVYAIGNWRGGSEYGPNWRNVGIKKNKENTFSDCSSGAEYLINNRYTNPSRLAIDGTFNGGLVAAVVAQRRPDLIKAVIIRSGILNMIRKQRNITVEDEELKDEYGSVINTNDFHILYGYSPLQNAKITRGQQWPASLVICGVGDDFPSTASDSLAYIARLHELAKDAAWQNPLLAFIGTDNSKSEKEEEIEEVVVVIAFLQRVFDIQLAL